MANISTDLEGSFKDNKTIYYDICNSYISGMMSAGISDNTIENCYQQYDGDFNTDNCYFYKYFASYDHYNSANSFTGGCVLIPIINKNETNTRPFIFYDKRTGTTNVYIGSTKSNYNDRKWKGRKFFTDRNFSGSTIYGSADIYNRLRTGLRYGNSGIKNLGDDYYNTTSSSNWSSTVFPNIYSASLVTSAISNYSEMLIDTNIPIFTEENKDKIKDWIDNGTRPTTTDIDKKTAFKLYIDGLNFPNYHLNWHNEAENNENFNSSLHNINISFQVYNNHLMQFDNVWTLHIPFSSGSFDFSWQDILDNNATWIYWGDRRTRINVSCDYFTQSGFLHSDDVGCILMNNKDSFDKMYTALITNTSDGSTFDVVQGVPDTDDDYSDPEDNDNDPNPDDDTELETSGVLTNCYSMTSNRLQSLGSFLFSSDFIDNILLVNNNPIENILSIKAIPFSISGVDTSIKLGNVDTNIVGAKCGESYKINIGSFIVNGKYNSYLDYSPFTTVEIFLPFIGMQKLDTNVLINRSINILYIVDCITGSLKVQLLYNKKPLYEFNGTIGVDIPISSTNRAQVELGYLSSGLGAVGSIASGNVMGAVYSGLNMAQSQYHTTTSGTANPNTSFHSNRKCYLIINRPKADTISSYASTIGNKCCLSLNLRNLSGMTKLNENVQLKNISCTNEEREMLRNILTNGFIL